MSDPKQDALEAIDPPGKGDETDSLDPELFDPGRTSDEFRSELEVIEGELEREIEKISELLENPDIAWEIAWGTMPADRNAPRRLVRSVLAPLRFALIFLKDHRSEEPGEPAGTSMAKVRAGIRGIRVLSVDDPRQGGCTLRDGLLTLKPCLAASDHPLRPVRGFEGGEIEWAIRDSLDLDVGPSIRRSEAAVARFVDKCRSEIAFEPEVTVDWGSFRAIGSGEKTLTALKRFREDLLADVRFALTQVNRRVPVSAGVKAIHFRHVGQLEERDIAMEGTRMIFSVPLVERDACYTADDLEDSLVELARHFPRPPAG
ncbi:MAG: hypothetical protein KA419_06515 [Acidobacteria bacterium]|nr:hypothetical protein [Acidobacteriota bacterium]